MLHFMNTIIITTCYLDEGRYPRMKKWLEYYLPKMNALGASKIQLLDNASALPLIHQLQDEVPGFGVTWDIHRYNDHLARGSNIFDYPYIWRAIRDLNNYFDKYDKIIYMDNDFYILSDKMFSYVKNLSSGWTAFWCPKHNFPETSCNVLIKGCSSYEKFLQTPIEQYNGTCFERTLPTTFREKGMIGDRYSEYPMNPPANADFNSQV